MNPVADLQSGRTHDAGKVTAPAPDALQFGRLARALDAIEHGLLLVDLTGRILHANPLARRELDVAGALRSADGMLVSGNPGWQQQIRQALQDAARDCRSIVELDFELELEHASGALSLAFIPFAALPGGTVDTVLVMSSQRHAGAMLALQLFGHANRLASAEQEVMGQLCGGHQTDEIAGLQGICISTLHTPIRNVDPKSGGHGIGDFVHRLSHRPQVESALRLLAGE